MKIIVIVFLVCAAIVSTNAKLTPDHIEKLRGMAAQCKAKEDATDDDINSMMALEFPKTPSGKCLHACMQETIGVIKNGKIDVETAVYISTMMFKDNEQMIKVAREVSEACASITDNDRCEMAVKAMKCSHDEINNRGIKISDYFI